jgi:hypothetical protein
MVRDVYWVEPTSGTTWDLVQGVADDRFDGAVSSATE